jgi:hypothetical protein
MFTVPNVPPLQAKMLRTGRRRVIRLVIKDVSIMRLDSAVIARDRNRE